ncbi:hypothetical protein PUN28_000774 [Cardiocondyla obscurior]|uniref:Uncharacterized protein n=1 Tax=Cardiocondyla obscurior TaxID=286306 RepID=A0AAW2H114_9HYME
MPPGPAPPLSLRVESSFRAQDTRERDRDFTFAKIIDHLRALFFDTAEKENPENKLLTYQSAFSGVVGFCR